MPFWVIPAAIAAGQAIISGIQAHRQKKENRRMAEYQNEANSAYLQQQLSYNDPQSQMARYQKAGLNPNLIYSQGNPGNQSAPQQAAPIQSVDYQSMMNNLGPLVNQSMMTQSQVQATDAKTRQTYAMTELNKLQAKLISSNPLLNDEGFKAVLDGLKSAAELKALDVKMADVDLKVKDASSGHVVNKLFHEVQLLEQRFNLGTQDAAIKAQVLKSKEFSNAILEIQKNFMQDGTITPQHILQFFQMLLLKLF